MKICYAICMRTRDRTRPIQSAQQRNILFYRNNPPTNYRDVSIKVLGFWWWWLFIVPSLRSRRPSGFEKKALDIAFLATPAISITAPIVTKDQAVICGANLAIVVGSYAFAYLTYDETGGRDSGKDQPEWLKFLYSSLDFGSGKERGLRK